jgi:hypothetical protein
LNKELAELIIFNSIFEAVKETGDFSLLQDKLEIIEPRNTILDKFIDLNSNSDYAYLKKSFNRVPEEYTLKYAGISGNFGARAQEEWFKNYTKNPNKYVVYILSSFLSKLRMNRKLREKINKDFLEYITSVLDIDTASLDTSEDEKEFLFSCEEFQDLIFITFAETIYNPEIEDDINTKFTRSNKLFWDRFNELYEKVFIKKFGENKLLEKGFFLDDVLMKYKKEYGFDVFDDALDKTIYPEYPKQYLPYFNFQDSKYQNKVNDEEYINFRKREFALYNDLCDKYGILKTRTKMM